ncbi:hypothetical protein ACFVJK_46330 [Streptomyces sp. NPDC127172]|uniref:hypothetical protein n=1 Tax=Streptomyces sp. NPDC127172 TaxID=3345382 RepID=UPI00363111B7
MSSEITRLVDELVAQMKSGSPRGFQKAITQLGDTARAGGPQALTATVEALAPWLPSLSGRFAKTAVLAGACVEWGGSPMALADFLPQRTADAMELNALVATSWAEAAPGKPLPPPDSASTKPLLRVLTPPAGTLGGVNQRDLTQIVMSWYDMEDWLKATITVLARQPFRAAVPATVKAELRDNAALVGDRSQRAGWVRDLASVLDDQQLIVLDPRTRRGYHLTMSGIGDNHQLHILLADRLIGDPDQGLVPGDRPALSWVEAATDGNPQLGLNNPAIRSFRLFDGHGTYISPQAVPANIEPLNSARVVVLHPPNGSFGMANGRTFENMTPTLSLDRILEPDETESWFTRIAPAVEDDLMAF